MRIEKIGKCPLSKNAMLSSFGAGQCFSKHNLVMQIWHEFVCYGFDNIGTWNIYQINLSLFTLGFFSKSLRSNYCCYKKISETNWPSICRKKKIANLHLTFGHKFDLLITKDTLIEFLLSISVHDLLESYKGNGSNGT